MYIYIYVFCISIFLCIYVLCMSCTNVKIYVIYKKNQYIYLSKPYISVSSKSRLTSIHSVIYVSSIYSVHVALYTTYIFIYSINIYIYKVIKA